MKNTIKISAALLVIWGAGVLFGMSLVLNMARAEAPAPADPVNVSIVYEESGEAREVTLTDSEGNPVELGSVAEEWPYLED